MDIGYIVLIALVTVYVVAGGMLVLRAQRFNRNREDFLTRQRARLTARPTRRPATGTHQNKK